MAGQNMKQLGSSSILQNAYYDSLFKMRLETADRVQAQGNVAQIAALCDEFDAGVSAIHQNPDLSAQGAAKGILDKSATYLKRLDEISGPMLASLSAQIAEHQAVLNRASDGGQTASVITELRAREVREQFAKIDVVMRPTEYQKLVREGNVEACLAIENAPYQQLLDTADIEEGRANRAALQSPERFAGLQSARQIKDLLTESVRFARKHLDQAPTNDPLQIAASGV